MEVYCNHEFIEAEKARIGLFDRGFLFGDAIYEVTAVIGGRMIDNDFHLERLRNSLSEIAIPLPIPLPAIENIQRELIARNALQEGTIYLQISRGEAPRNFLFDEKTKPTFVAFTSARKLSGTKAHLEGVAVDITPDPRWMRRDIKTVMLLGQVLAKQASASRGFDEVWFVEDGFVTEGASSSAFIVTKDGRIVTRANSQAILPGCTRSAVMRLCADESIIFEERSFTPTEAVAAAEVFLTSASSFITPVVRIGDELVANGQPGPLTRRLQDLYFQAALGGARLDATQ